MPIPFGRVSARRTARSGRLLAMEAWTHEGAPSIESDGAPGNRQSSLPGPYIIWERQNAPERRAHLLGCEGAGLATVRDIGRLGAVESVVAAAGMGMGDIRRRRATPRPPCRHARRDRARRRAEELSPLQGLAERGASHARPRGSGTACLIVRYLCDHIPNRHHHRLHSSGELFRVDAFAPQGADVSPQPLAKMACRRRRKSDDGNNSFQSRLTPPSPRRGPGPDRSAVQRVRSVYRA